MLEGDNGAESVDNTEVDLERREVLASLAKYTAMAGASTVVLTASASVSVASVSGSGGQNPGNNKPVGKAPFSGTQGQVPSGRLMREAPSIRFPKDLPSRNREIH